MQRADFLDDRHRRRVHRDRRGRGMRGPALLPRNGRRRAPAGRTDREFFDHVVIETVAGIDERWSERLGLVEYAVEDTPQLPDDWSSTTVPLSSLIRGAGSRPTRLVVFRRPIERRAADRAELEAMVLTVVVEQVAELLEIAPGEVDPRCR